MARKSAAWVARNRVEVDHNPETGSISLQVATNEDWTPEYEDDSGGVPEHAAEVATAGAALAIRLHQELGGALSLRAWIIREQDKRGRDGKGLSRLAADLLGLPTIPKREPKLSYGKQSAEWKAHAAELRKLEEYRQGKYKSASGARRQRIASLPGAQAGNPYLPVPPLGSVLNNYSIALGARADWRVSEDYYPFTLKHSDPEDPGSEAHDMLMNSPRDFLPVLIGLIDENIIGAGLKIEGHVYSLQVQARQIRKRGRAAPMFEGPTPKQGPRKHKPGGGRKWVF